MRIVIFGATGIVGKQLIKLALYKNYNVVAYGRNVHELIDDQERNGHLSLIKGGLFDKGDIEDAVKNADVVFSVISGDLDSNDHTRSLGMKNIVSAMQKHGVKRILALGGIGCLKNEEEKILLEMDDFPEELKLVTTEHLKALQYLTESDLDWTFVCPPTIIDEEVTGQYKVIRDYATNVSSIHSGDIAQFLLIEAISDEYIKSMVNIGN